MSNKSAAWLATAALSAVVQLAPATGWAQAGPDTRRRPEEMQADPFRAFDINKDGLLDAAEVKSAAAARFDELNPDQDDQLDPREAAPVLEGEAFRQADSDRNGQVNKAEYLELVDRLFLAADANGDKRLSPEEFASERGQLIMRLLR